MFVRLIFLICAVALMFDLAGDGCIGKAKFVAPQHAAQYSVPSSAHEAGPADSQIAVLPAILRDTPSLFPNPPSVEVDHRHKISSFPLRGGSGGLPL